MNNKGFMMAEVIVVSAVIMVTLVGLYTSYNKIFSLYNQRLNYYDVATLYKLAYIRDNNIDEILNTVNTNKTIDGNLIYYTEITKVKDKSINKSGLKKTFKEYLDYLSTSLDFDNMKINGINIDNILIMEKCSDENNCKYTYLEVKNNE